jgi:hypothetical protein
MAPFMVIGWVGHIAAVGLAIGWGHAATTVVEAFRVPEEG